MIHILSTVHQVDELTAVIWLARVIMPIKQYNAKALSTYYGLYSNLSIRPSIPHTSLQEEI